MKKYYITNCGLQLEIDRERALKIKALQLLFSLQKKGNHDITLKECREIVENEMK